MNLTHAIHQHRRSRGYLLAAALSIIIIGGCSDDNDESVEATGSSNKENTAVQRTAVNPWSWSIELGFNQGELVTGGSEVLYLAGQSSVNADGAPLHAGDMAAQIALALDNLEAVLAEAGMDLSNVVRLNTYTTDVDAVFQNYLIIAERLGAAGVQPPGSLLGVARLAYPELLVELEATAVR
jgi:enamine deaminase RidA (YjgF/YER057c/UK114 family)